MHISKRRYTKLYLAYNSGRDLKIAAIVLLVFPWQLYLSHIKKLL